MHWDFYVSMATVYDANGFLGIQVDGFGEEQSGVAALESHHMYGHAGRPLDPVVDPTNRAVADPAQATNVLLGQEGDSKSHVFALEDPRVVQALPPLAKGAGMLYGAWLLPNVADPTKNDVITGWHALDATGSTLYIPYRDAATQANKAFIIQVDLSTPGQEALTISHGNGVMIQMLATGELLLKNRAGTATITLNDLGTTIIGPLKVQGALTSGSVADSEPLALAPALLEFLAAVAKNFAAMSVPAPLTPDVLLLLDQIAAKTSTGT